MSPHNPGVSMPRATDAPAARERVRRVITARDAVETRRMLEDAFSTTVRVSGEPDVRPVRLVRVDGGPFVIDEISLPGRLRFEVSAVPDPLFVCLRAGVVARRTAAERARYEAPDVFVAAQPYEPFVAQSTDAVVRLVVVGWPMLAEALGLPPDAAPRSVRFRSLSAASPALARQWARAVDYAADEVLAHPEAMAQPLIVTSVGRLLASTALAAFPHTVADEVTRGEGAGAGTQALRRAIAYIETYAGADIALADIASAAQVSPRALQYAFRQYRGTTPLAYLRGVRLERAHHDLRRADRASGDTVTAIAYRWGFLHQGRFAAAYRAAYGEAPATTLRRPPSDELDADRSSPATAALAGASAGDDR